MSSIGQSAMRKRLMKNNAALVGWVFIAVWMALLCAMSVMLLRTGKIEGLSTSAALAVMALFWAVGLYACNYFFRVPLITIWLDDGHLIVRERWVKNSREIALPVQSVEGRDPQAVEFREEKDSDGNPYYAAILKLPDGREIRIKEGHTKAFVEEARQQMLEAIAKSARREA